MHYVSTISARLKRGTFVKGKKVSDEDAKYLMRYGWAKKVDGKRSTTKSGSTRSNTKSASEGDSKQSGRPSEKSAVRDSEKTEGRSKD